VNTSDSLRLPCRLSGRTLSPFVRPDRQWSRNASASQIALHKSAGRGISPASVRPTAATHQPPGSRPHRPVRVCALIWRYQPAAEPKSAVHRRTVRPIAAHRSTRARTLARRSTAPRDVRSNAAPAPRIRQPGSSHAQAEWLRQFGERHQSNSPSRPLGRAVRAPSAAAAASTPHSAAARAEALDDGRVELLQNRKHPMRTCVRAKRGSWLLVSLRSRTEVPHQGFHLGAAAVDQRPNHTVIASRWTPTRPAGPARESIAAARFPPDRPACGRWRCRCSRFARQTVQSGIAHLRARSSRFPPVLSSAGKSQRTNETPSSDAASRRNAHPPPRQHPAAMIHMGGNQVDFQVAPQLGENGQQAHRVRSPETATKTRSHGRACGAPRQCAGLAPGQP